MIDPALQRRIDFSLMSLVSYLECSRCAKQFAALAVDDSAMLSAVSELAEREGIVTSPEGGATLAALKRLLADGFLSGHETLVSFLTASGYRYAEVLQALASEKGS